LWLKIGTTNNDPRVTARYFLQTVQKLQYLPNKMRSDKGSENSLICKLQVSLRLSHDDEDAGENSFKQGKSTRNQRIEAYWG